MKKIRSQLAVGFVCILLGYMLTYQFMLLTSEEKKISSEGTVNSTEITSEIDGLKKQKEDLEKRNNDLINQIKVYEEAATNQNQTSKEIKNQLDTSRLLLGERDVQGEGIIITLAPNTNMFSPSSSPKYITHNELVYLINELNFAGAQAISVNDNRITSQTGLRSSGGTDNYIAINDGRISPKDKIVIKAVGNKNLLAAALDFQGTLDHGNLKEYKITYEKKDKIQIFKVLKNYKHEYLQPVE
jgi:uncharacterized protein YlxW (UPF0749 family)